MSLLTLVGFDHIASTETAANNLALALPWLNGTTFMSNMTSGVSGVSDGAGSTSATTRRYLTGGLASSFYINFSATPAAYARTGKWYMGARMRPLGATPTVNSTLLYLTLGASNLSQAVIIPAVQASYYVEVEIDWVNSVANCYLNGELVNSYSGTTYFPTTATNIAIRLGGYTAIPTGGKWGLTDFYFAVDAAGEAHPLGGRLGQIMVKPQTIASVDNAALFVPQNSGVAVVDALNAASSGTINVNGVNTDPRGQLAQLNYAAPAETNAIKGVHVFSSAWRDPSASAGYHVDVAQGSLISTKTAVPVTTGVTPLVPLEFPMNVDLNGEAWTPAKIAQLKVHIGSYRP